MHAGWTEFVSANEEAPSPERYGHSLTTFNYDDILVVCFGGTSGEGVTSQVNTVWSWTVAKGWHQVSTSGPSPPHRAWHGAAALGTSLYIFGGNRWEAHPGQKPTRSVHGDLWVLNTESWTWRQIMQSKQHPWPTSRSAMGMAAHGECLLLYGGRGVGTGFLGDVWVFSPATGSWAPIQRVLATFISTPFGVFLYGGARQVAASPNARAPLCDLWQLRLDDSKGSSSQPVYVWEDCNKVPMCAVEHTVACEDGTPPSQSTTAAGERVVVGHDAHAAAFVEPSHLVVWSGVLGRMPKRGVLSSAPPPPQLTGNLFSIDLAAIDRGWSMVPAARLSATDVGVGPVVPRRWAAMAALGPGRAVVHGGLADQKVLGQAAVLEIQEAAVSSPRGAHSSPAGDDATTPAQTADLLSLDVGAAAAAGQDPFSINSPSSSVPGDAAHLKPPSPQGRESPALGPLKSSSVMSAVLGGVRRGMETISSEAASVIQRVTNTGKPEGEMEDSLMAGHVRYSQPPALASTSAGPGPQRAAAGFWGGDDASTPIISRDFIESWLRANSSSADSSVKVLVATSDRLTKPRESLPAAEAAAAASASEGPATSGSAQDAAAAQQPAEAEAGGGPSTPLTVQTGTVGGGEEEGDVESPVSLWISPSPKGPHSPLSSDQNSAAFSSSRQQLQAADEDAHAVMDIMEELLGRVATCSAQQAPALQASGSGEEDFQFDKLPIASVPAVPSVWPLGPPESPPQARTPVEAATAPHDKDVPTAYVQDMLTTDPVHELGLRVTRISSSTLEFVSLSEAKTELRRVACAWLLSVPCAECLRRKDVDALWTEYRRAAPHAMTQIGKNTGLKLGTLMHLARKDLRMRDIPKLLSEFKQLRQLAPSKSRPG